MNQDMTMIFARTLDQGFFKRIEGLGYGSIPDCMKCHLKPQLMRRHHKIIHLFLGVKKVSPIGGIMGIRFTQCGILRAKTAIQRICKTAADTAHTPSFHLFRGHGLKKSGDRLRQCPAGKTHQVHVQIHGIAHPFCSVEDRDPFFGQMNPGGFNVLNQLHRRYAPAIRNTGSTRRGFALVTANLTPHACRNRRTAARSN